MPLKIIFLVKEISKWEGLAGLKRQCTGRKRRGCIVYTV